MARSRRPEQMLGFPGIDSGEDPRSGGGLQRRDQRPVCRPRVGRQAHAVGFPIEDKDVISVANAPVTELQKVFTVIDTVTGPMITGVVVSRSDNGG